MEQYRDVLTKREITWLIEAEDTAAVNLAIKKKNLLRSYLAALISHLVWYILRLPEQHRYLMARWAIFCAVHYSEMAVT